MPSRHLPASYVVLLAALAGCARPVPAEPAGRIAPHPAGLPATPLTANVIVTERAASLAGTTTEDDVRNLPRFERLDGLYGELKRLRGAYQDRDIVGKDAPEGASAVVEARPNATSLAVFSAVATCAYAGYRHVGLRGEDGAFVAGEILVMDPAGHSMNSRVVNTVLKARLRPDGVDVAWRGKRSCAQLPAGGQTTVSELGAWVDGVCPAGGCFDLALLWVDPRVSARDAMRGLANLESRATKPFLYSALVVPDASAPQQSCDGAQ
jgi:hypothetical protein